jgi:hypothetical protein
MWTIKLDSKRGCFILFNNKVIATYSDTLAAEKMIEGLNRGNKKKPP